MTFVSHCDKLSYMTTTTTTTILVAVYDDGFGTFQARCLGCSWRGRWYRSEALAVKQGKTHLGCNS